jgi:hypothetical protein
MCKVLRAVESPLLGYNDLQSGFEELWDIGVGVGRGIRRSSTIMSGVRRRLMRLQRSLLSFITP